MSGLQIFAAFPASARRFRKETDRCRCPTPSRSADGWAAPCSGTSPSCGSSPAVGLLYVAVAAALGHWRTVVFAPRDLPWRLADGAPLLPVRTQAGATGQYNPLQKLAYTSTLRSDAFAADRAGDVQAGAVLGAGLVLRRLSRARLIHFLSMCGLLAFIPGHLIMVVLHGWDNFASMVTGWKRRPLDETRT